MPLPRSTRPINLCSSIILGAGLLFWGGAGGCSSEKQLVISPGPYTGPAVRVDSSGPQHLVVITTPTGGWAVQFDQTRRQFERTEVFITLREPNPILTPIQAPVEHIVATTVSSQSDASICVRSLPFRQEATGFPYRHALEVVGVAAPGPPPVATGAPAAAPPATAPH